MRNFEMGHIRKFVANLSGWAAISNFLTSLTEPKPLFL